MIDKKIAFIASAAVIITSGLYSGYYFYNKETNFNKDLNSSEDKGLYNVEAAVEKESLEEETIAEDKTTDRTKLIYEYRYISDKVIRRKEKPIFPELINKTASEIENAFNDWEIVSFGKDEIVLRKDIIDSDTTDYLLKDYNGVVAVFYNVDSEEKLKEYTETPTALLPENEQALLKEGIPVKGNKNLLKILQDYES